MWPTASSGYPTATIPDNPHRNGRKHTGAGHTCPRFLSCHARRNPPGKPPIYNKCIAEGRKSNGLGEAEPCLTAGERSEPADRGHTPSRPRRGRISIHTPHTDIGLLRSPTSEGVHPASAGSLRSPAVKHGRASPQPSAWHAGMTVNTYIMYGGERTGRHTLQAATQSQQPRRGPTMLNRGRAKRACGERTHTIPSPEGANAKRETRSETARSATPHLYLYACRTYIYKTNKIIRQNLQVLI